MIKEPVLWIWNVFFGSGSYFSVGFGSVSGSCFGSYMNLYFKIEHSRWEVVNFYQFFRIALLQNSFRIRRCPDPEWFFPDPDPAKSFGSDRIRIHNIVKNNYECWHGCIRMCLSNKKLTLTKTNSEIPNDLFFTESNNFSLVAQSKTYLWAPQTGCTKVRCTMYSVHRWDVLYTNLTVLT